MNKLKYESFEEIWNDIGKDFDKGIYLAVNKYNDKTVIVKTSEDNLMSLMIAENICEKYPSLFLEYSKEGKIYMFGRGIKRIAFQLKKIVCKNWADIFITVFVLSVLFGIGYRLYEVIYLIFYKADG